MSLARKLQQIDRRIIYMFVFISLAIPILSDVVLPPAKMQTAVDTFKVVEELPRDGKVVLISADWGPNTLAENLPQTELVIEHLLRRRIPFAMMTVYSLGAPFIERIPKQVAEKLEKENPGESWEYGKDWINLGYRPGMILFIQGMAKAENLSEYLKADYQGTPLKQLPLMDSVKTIKDISSLVEITGLSGVLQIWIQFFGGPKIIHGCTSIGIPDTYIYYTSKQVEGFFEGVAGAAYYDTLMSKEFSGRESGSARKNNSSLSFAQLVILFFILVGNIAYLVERKL